MLAVIAVFLSLFFIGFDQLKINIDTPNGMDEGWVYNNQPITLPINLNVEKHTPYEITHELSVDFNDQQFILFRTSLQDIKVYLEDVLIYEKTYGHNQLEPYASTWHTIPVSNQSEGKILKIILVSPYSSMSGTVNEMFYGSEIMIYKYLMNTYMPRLALGVIVLTIGLIVMISNFFMSYARDKGYVYMGLFAVTLSFWIIAESKMLQFFTGSQLLIGTLAYISIPIFPIPMIIYLTEYVLKDYKKMLIWLKYLFVAHFIAITVLHFTGIQDYFETVIYSQLWIVVGIILATVSLILDYKNHKNLESIKIFKSLIIIIIFGVFEFINFILGGFEYTSLYLSIGIVVIMAYILINYINYIVSRLKKSYETEVYQKLAYMDHVIQGKNRLAFEIDLDLIYADDKKLKDLRLILFDLDNLKKINDTFGHVAGDEAIKKAYDIMQEVFKDYGVCYRIGGDEFACIYLNPNPSIYEEKLVILEGLVKAVNKTTPYEFGISVGSAIHREVTVDQTELFNLADTMMYQYRKIKQQQ
ncbi:GGDEF domain-containing protein [Acholeplasma equirhinis]|uniref:GGDEF domain-containing protein n=1 Tax=Acholeplasma equirhinis TaxID=555393 RepID=UPI00197AB795|nr:GGDEF domain-containing protein [Acholeplasma equirhinis]MBN3490438.1 GGDEF domain-containing protein [Acholeplasma equirhinis]